MCQTDTPHRRARGVCMCVCSGGATDKQLLECLPIDALTCFSFSSSMRSLSSMQLRACRKAFLWARSVRMRTNSPDRLTLVKSTVFAINYIETTKKGCLEKYFLKTNILGCYNTLSFKDKDRGLIWFGFMIILPNKDAQYNLADIKLNVQINSNLIIDLGLFHSMRAV